MIRRNGDHGDAEQTAVFMRALAAVPVEGGPIPDPAFLWWKAQLLRRWDADQRAIAPIEAGERVDAGVGVAGGVLLLAWLWRIMPAAASWGPVVAIAAVASAVLLLLAAAFAAWSFLAPNQAAGVSVPDRTASARR